MILNLEYVVATICNWFLENIFKKSSIWPSNMHPVLSWILLFLEVFNKILFFKGNRNKMLFLRFKKKLFLLTFIFLDHFTKNSKGTSLNHFTRYTLKHIYEVRC